MLKINYGVIDLLLSDEKNKKCEQKIIFKT